MSVSLAAEADNGNGLSVKLSEVAIGIIILCDHFLYLLKVKLFQFVCNGTALKSGGTGTAHFEYLVLTFDDGEESVDL